MADAEEVVARLQAAAGRQLHRRCGSTRKGSSARIATRPLRHRRARSRSRASEKFLKRNQNRTLRGELRGAARHDRACTRSTASPVERGVDHGRVRLQLRGRHADRARARAWSAQVFEHRGRARRRRSKSSASPTRWRWATPATDQAHGRRGARHVSRPATRPASARHARHGHRQRLCRPGDGRRHVRRLRRGPRRLPVRRPQGRGRQRLHRRPRVHVRGDGHRDRHRPRQADRVRARSPRTSSAIRCRARSRAAATSPSCASRSAPRRRREAQRFNADTVAG